MAKAIASTPIQVIKRVWERIAPLQLAERTWDNVGVMIEAPYPDTSRKQVLLTIDLTTAVCNEALALPSCSVIVSYHPPIFRGLKSLGLDDPIQASLLKLSAKGISVFSPHTSLDATPNGINTWLAKPFEANTAKSKTITDSTNVQGFEDAGMGKMIHLKDELGVMDVVKTVKEHLGLSHVQLASPPSPTPISSIALCAGSGSSLFSKLSTPADLYLTGEMSHHEVLSYVAKGSSIILCNHTNTERGYLSAVLKGWLEKELNDDKGVEEGSEGNEGDEGEKGGWEVLVSKADEDPLRVV